jgi:diguanylate cyclase (GGDEF)-like protein
MGRSANKTVAERRPHPLSQLLSLTPDHGYILSEKGRIEAANDVALAELGTPRADLLSKPFHPMVMDVSRDALSEMLLHLQQGEVVRGVEISLLIAGNPRTFSFSAKRYHTDTDRPGLCLLLGRDITALAKKAQENEYRSLHDRLTGAYNRWYLDEILKREEDRAKRYRHSIAFIMVDVDYFKAINDRYGHQIGDRALRWISDQLQSTLRVSDFVVRLGGDEFLMVLPETDGEVTAVGRRLLEAIARAGNSDVEPFLPMQVSIGTSSWSADDGRSITDALEEADREMYRSRSER